MPGSSLLTLIDDIASLLDDVAALSNVAAKKTAGVMGDDLALNAEQVAGVSTDRELPVVWAVAKGSLLNKVILVPIALTISAFIPRAILPLLMIGGIFLCYEGFEKVWHKLFHAGTDLAERQERLAHLADPALDLVALERTKVKGAIRTDFILSAEIIVIALGTMATQPLPQQIAALSVLAIGMTVLVYGLVAGIVKLDDFGIRLQRGSTRGDVSHVVGSAILTGAPLLMKALSVLGTAAMFLVGGGIVVHAIPQLEHFAQSWSGATAAGGVLVTTALNAAIGVAVGGLTMLIVSGLKALRK
jgi:uncharacterized protein